MYRYLYLLFPSLFFTPSPGVQAIQAAALKRIQTRIQADV